MNHWQSHTRIRTTDRLFSKYIRLRDKECVYQVKCYGHQEFSELDCSHFQSRRHESIRFDPQNADAACRKCHEYVGTAEGKKWLTNFKIRQLGEREYDLLMFRKESVRKADDVLDKLYINHLLQEVQ